jgi:hypothetical protein
MTQSHKSSLIIAQKKVVPCDNNTALLMHYDITENDVLRGIEPTGTAVFTLRSYEGYYGGGIAIEEATTNLETIGTSLSVWGGATIAQSIVSGGLFDGWNRVDVSSAGTTGHICWMPYLVLASGNKYSFSIDYYCPNNDVILRIDGGTGFGAMTNVGGFRYEMNNIQPTASISENFWWYHKSAASGNVNTFFYYRYPQCEQKAFSTSFVNGSRSSHGTLKYPADCINPSEGTISFWYKPEYPNSVVTTQENSPKPLQVGTYYGNSSISIWNIWSSSSVDLRLYVKGATNGGWSLATLFNYTLSQNTWVMVSVTWSGTSWKLYINGVRTNTVVATETLGPIAGNLIYVGGDGIGQSSSGHVCNGIIDEFRIDKVARTDDEIMSWYYSQTPFYPKGIYTVAY